MPKILDWKKIDPRKHFRYSPPKAGQSHGGFSVKVEVLDEDTGKYVPFFHQGPPLALPFGFNEKEDGKGGIRYSASFSFPTVKRDPSTGEYRGDPQTLQYFNFIKSIDEFNKEKAFEQCQTWFKKKYEPNVINEFYFDNIYESEKVLEGLYSPTFNTKLMFYNGKWESKFFKRDTDKHVHEITYDETPSSGIRKAVPLLESTGMWFAGKSFGMSFRVCLLLIFEEDKFTGCAIDMGDAGESIPRSVSMIEYSDDEDQQQGTKRQAEDEADGAPGSKVPAFNPPPGDATAEANA